MEDIAKKHGEKLRKGRLGADGDVEFYDEEADEIVAQDETQKKEHEELMKRIKMSLDKEKT
jgi:protein import protein ZIM17